MALNQMQQQAVQHTEGPLLILAGAGSGKTTVLVNRVQHIIADGYKKITNKKGAKSGRLSPPDLSPKNQLFQLL